jgi:predicted glycoside hydrolase/deacetylase ChbG (UPF0249 family)
LDSEYCAVRPAEVEALCSPEVRKVIDESGIILTSFAQIKPILIEKVDVTPVPNP